MTKKEKQEHIEFIQSIVDKDIKFGKRKEELVLGFIFNILTNNTILNRYIYTQYGNIEKNEVVRITDCINYIYKKLENNEEE